LKILSFEIHMKVVTLLWQDTFGTSLWSPSKFGFIVDLIFEREPSI